jgi:hypothetical protein
MPFSPRQTLLVPILLCAAICGAAAQENYPGWAVLQNPFESTGGGGIMIDGYRPIIAGSKCSTNFTATEPNGTVYRNVVEFDAVEVQGGTLCHNGKWRALDGSSSGTTGFRVFLKDGVWRRSP